MGTCCCSKRVPILTLRNHWVSTNSASTAALIQVTFRGVRCLIEVTNEGMPLHIPPCKVCHTHFSASSQDLGRQPRKKKNSERKKIPSSVKFFNNHNKWKIDSRSMPALRQANWNVSDGDLQSSTTNYAQAGRDQVYENPSSPTESPRHSVSSLPYPFDSQSSLENDNGSHGMYRTEVETMSRS